MARTAVIHDWLNQDGGAEKVLQSILHQYPGDLYTLFSDPRYLSASQFADALVITSSLNRIPLLNRHHRLLLPFFPKAIEGFDLRRYDLVLSSSYAVAKNIIPGPNSVHVSMVHSPIRYAWDMEQEYTSSMRGLQRILLPYVRKVLHDIRIWDAVSTNRSDYIATNSAFIGRRVEKYYRRKSCVIYAPVDTDAFQLETQKDRYFFAHGRMVPYKRMELIAETFTRYFPKEKLIIAGDGPDFSKVKKASGPNVELLGFLPRAELVAIMRNARAYLFAAEEDFGIAPIEAQATGTPVVAFGRGGALETIEENRTGVFFAEQTPESIRDAVQKCLLIDWDPIDISRHAGKFSRENFDRRYRVLVDGALERRDPDLLYREIRELV